MIASKPTVGGSNPSGQAKILCESGHLESRRIGRFLENCPRSVPELHQGNHRKTRPRADLRRGPSEPIAPTLDIGPLEGFSK